MAKMVLKDASVVIGGVDLSDHVSSVTLNYSAEAIEDTAMGQNTRSRIGGLKDWSAEIEFHQDYASGSVDDTLFDLVGTQVTFVGKPTSAAVGATNPSFSGTGLLETYTPMGGAVGELHATSISIQAASDLTRATA